MTTPIKQHLIDPEICIRCYTCEAACPVDAIEHDENNVVVNADTCDYCMECIAPCPTGAIDEWRVVTTPYSLDEQYGWTELPAQEEIAAPDTTEAETSMEAIEASVAALIEDAHRGTGGKPKAPASASKPSINLYTIAKPATAVVQGNYRLTAPDADSDVRHLILDMGAQPFPVLEGQSIGIIAPGTDADGKPHLPRLYSVSSPRDGERPNYNNLSLTVKREPSGVCSNYVCDLEQGDEVKVVGPFGSTFLMPNDPDAKLLMVCTGTGAAPFRAFTMRRQRTKATHPSGMTIFFGARTPEGLPYFGPLKKVPDEVLKKHLCYSRVPGQPKQYVQDRLREEQDAVAALMVDPAVHIYICGLRGMEEGVESAFHDIAANADVDWNALRDTLRSEGRYHVETY